MEQQDTGKFRNNTKDQFYTHPSVAKKCIEDILKLFPNTSTYKWVEPSAGNGSFLKEIPPTFDKIGIDIDPKYSGIEKADFLVWNPPSGKQIILFGNPPFGRQSSTAKLFIKKGCSFADIIAFILPKSFTKPSMSNVFDLQFHCRLSKELEPNSFLLNGEAYNVPCVFQIWEKSTEIRTLQEKIKEIGFEYVKSTDSYDIACRRVGGCAGKCFKKNGTEYAVQSHYFIKLQESFKKNLDTIIMNMNSHTFPSNTVGPRSLSKSEINEVLNLILQQFPSS